MRLLDNKQGGYRFLEGIAPYSSGVVAHEGNEIVHVTLMRGLPWEEGIVLARKYVEAQGLQRFALCGFELRCPAPHAMDSFIGFNADYRRLLEAWDMMVDGENPVARTNVSPVVDPPAETMLYAFSFVRPANHGFRTFVVAGGGELIGGRAVENIVCVGDTSDDAMVENARAVVGLMKERMYGLGGGVEILTTIGVYTAHPVRTLLQDVLLPELTGIRRRGVQWSFAQPPVIDIEFEMDMRGIVIELLVAL